jgi:NAD(P)-dependent dehydrogenase (short-subunit alcohol dehydrogenase family)
MGKKAGKKADKRRLKAQGSDETATKRERDSDEKNEDAQRPSKRPRADESIWQSTVSWASGLFGFGGGSSNPTASASNGDISKCPFFRGELGGFKPTASTTVEQSAGTSDSRKTMILTGGSRGIGHATVKRFSSAGWRVITCSRKPFPKEQCPWAHGEKDHIQVDLSNPADVAKAIEEMKCRVNGKVHALVNNAAISPKEAGGKRPSSVTTSIEDWKTVMQVNFFAPIMLAQGLIQELKIAKGSIVNVSSIAGTRVHPFAGSAYATSKAALACLTREMASDFGQTCGIRVNAISPGEIDTAILSPGTQDIVSRIPMQRLGTTAEVADVIFFLCSDQSTYVNGTELHVNGGQHV